MDCCGVNRVSPESETASVSSVRFNVLSFQLKGLKSEKVLLRINVGYPLVI